MRALHQRTQAPVIATLGRHGARILAEDGALLTVPGQPVERVADTIGAGDAHAGAVLLGLSRGLSLPEAEQTSLLALQQRLGDALGRGAFPRAVLRQTGRLTVSSHFSLPRA